MPLAAFCAGAVVAYVSLIARRAGPLTKTVLVTVAKAVLQVCEGRLERLHDSGWGISSSRGKDHRKREARRLHEPGRRDVHIARYGGNTDVRAAERD